MKIGKFETIGFVGGGNFGKVFRATDTLLDVERAIKIIQVQNPKSFVDAINEAKVLERCRHSHIVDIKEIDIQSINGNSYPCIVTEYLKNGSVQSAIEDGFISVKQASQIIVDSLLGLEHAHGQGITHRDIKPGNILFADNGQAKLSDFGLAYGLANQAFNFAGYNSHLPPEVLEGTAQDTISDLYSMGVTYYRVINNMNALDLNFADDREWLKAVKREAFPERVFQPHIPEQFRRIIRKSIRADRGRRFQNCLELRQAIQKIPLAIDWRPINPSHWEGGHQNDIFEIKIYSKRTGYFIDFLRNGRKWNEKCFVQMSNGADAHEQFYTLISETTVEI